MYWIELINDNPFIYFALKNPQATHDSKFLTFPTFCCGCPYGNLKYSFTSSKSSFGTQYPT